jgi:rubredoxin
MQTQSVAINFKGGIISPGYLKEILEIAKESRVGDVSFGLRQQLIMEIPPKYFETFIQSCAEKKISFYKSKDAPPNIVSSYPAAGIFAQDNWLREGVYKDIFDYFDYVPQLKINICDRHQSFTPFYSGHINWVSSSSDHFWQLFIRFPKTNKLYKWQELIYTNDLVTLSRKIEQEILSDRFLFYGNENADGDLLRHRLKLMIAYVSKPSVEEPVIDFSLPYYEGFNIANNRLWLGVYRRDELYPVSFLIDVCDICLNNRTGQLYATPWKSIIIKNIDSSNRKVWDYVLGKYRINVRHAANELNWQVEDGSEEGLQLKRHIIRYFDKEDVRTYGLCFAVQTKPTSSMFGNIIIQKQQTKNPHRLKSLERYNILYKKSFNPNERENVLFREGVEKEHLGVYLVSLCKIFYEQLDQKDMFPEHSATKNDTAPDKKLIYQCSDCYTVYDPDLGDEEQNIAAGTSFESLPSTYHCSLCEASSERLLLIEDSPGVLSDRA